MYSTAQNLPQMDSPELRELFADVPQATLERSRSIIYAANSGFELIYVNPAWDAFALGNGAPQLTRERVGTCSVVDCAGPLKRFYADLFGSVASTQKPADHEFQCSSRNQLRRFQMRVLPTRAGGVLVVNSLLVEQDHEDDHSGAAVETYVDNDRIITMCSHCRRTKQPVGTVWDWVPEFIEHQPEQVSHGLCPVCLEFHYLRHKRP